MRGSHSFEILETLMKHALVLAFFLCLSGCAANCGLLPKVPPATLSTAADEISEQTSLGSIGDLNGKALIIVGTTLPNWPKNALGNPTTVYTGLIRFDGGTGARIGRENVLIADECDIPLLVGFRKESKACSSVQFHAYIVEPGNYALGWNLWATYNDMWMVTNFEALATSEAARDLQCYAISLRAQVPKGALSFHVEPNQVVYVGNMVLDHLAKKAEWRQTPADARQFLDQQNKALGARLVAAPGIAYAGAPSKKP